MLLFSLIFAAATQVEPVLVEPEQRQVVEDVLGRHYRFEERAAAVCGFRGDTSHTCDDLEHFNVLESSHIDTPSGLRAKASFTRAEGCQNAVSLRFWLRHEASSVLVDWQKSSLDIDGVAQPLLPGFARRITAAVSQRPSVAAAGVEIIEEAYVDPGGPGLLCIATLSPAATTTVVGLHLAVQIGGRDDVVHIRQSLKWEPAAEPDVVAVLTTPTAPIQPDAPPLPLAAIGAGVGGAVGLGAGAGLALLPVIAGSAFDGGQFGCVFAACGVPFAAAGALGGYLPLQAIESAERSAFDDAERARKRRAAFLEHRKRLGMPEPAP